MNTQFNTSDTLAHPHQSDFIKKIKNLAKFSLLSLGFIPVNLGWAQETEKPARQSAHLQIQEQVLAFAKQLNNDTQYSRIDYEATMPDPRLRIEVCPTPLEIENRTANRNIGRLTLKVACRTATKPWAINTSLNIVAYDNVVVSSRAIPKATKITRSMLSLQERDVTRFSQGYFKDFSHVTDSITKYSVSGNKTLTPGNLLPPMLVSRGEKVVINAQASGLSIRATGTAMGDGALGDLVRVKNSQTARIVEGRVSAPGQVTINL
ncbi:MAG: flagellar basal body P-ring formation protein FlgA [Pseudomonadales bacterium]|nr:flagellar basal body P-ring formation protein FlgA [Pseudomonadales bacterium]